MADLQTSLNDNLVAAGLNTSAPSQTYTDFADTISKNQADQASQEQALELAKQHVAQAKIQTSNEQGAQAAGVNPLLMDVMTPDQAVAYLRLILKEKGLTITDGDINNWAKTLTGPVNRNIVEEFANRFARESTRAAQPAQFSTDDKIAIPEGSTAKDLGLDADKSDPTVGHVPQDGMYQVVYDNQGNIKKFIPGGKEPVDPAVKNAAKSASDADKQWQKLDTTINTAFKTRSGGLGSLSTAIFRSVRAINTLTATPNLTAQDLANVAQDVAGIFQGGAPTVIGVQDNDYHVALLNMANWFRAQTGVMANIGHMFGKDNSPLEPTKRKLLQVCTDLRDSAINNLKSFTESEEPAYRDIIQADEAAGGHRWPDMQAAKLKFIESGLLVPPDAKTQLNITGMDEAAPTKNPRASVATTVPASTTVGTDDDKKAALRKKLGL